MIRKNRLKRMRRLRPGKVTNAFQDMQVEIAIMKKLYHPNGKLNCTFLTFSVIKLYEVIDDSAKDKLYMGFNLEA
jgi:hypothetical protein